MNKQTIQICSPNTSIFQTICYPLKNIDFFQSICYPLKNIDYPSGGLFTTSCWCHIITSLCPNFEEVRGAYCFLGRSSVRSSSFLMHSVTLDTCMLLF